MTETGHSWVCLMYHDVMPETTASGGGPERFTVPITSFDLMLDAIADAGYHACSLSSAIETRQRRQVAITFDDGTIGQYDHAVPALRARSMTATFFVVTDWVGRPGFMTWDHLRQLVSWGMSVQSHTKSHRFLSELSAEDVRCELAESKAALDTELDQATTGISLPGGNAPKRAHRRFFAEAGYRDVAGSRWGMNSDVSEPTRAGKWIRRCTMRGRLGKEEAQRVLTGDLRLTLARYPREALLNAVRGVLGASTYARWRQWTLDRFA